jgi:hypothetical protein
VATLVNRSRGPKGGKGRRAGRRSWHGSWQRSGTRDATRGSAGAAGAGWSERDAQRVRPWRILLGQLTSPILLPRRVRTSCRPVLRDVADALVIFVVVALSAWIGLLREYRVARALASRRQWRRRRSTCCVMAVRGRSEPARSCRGTSRCWRRARTLPPRAANRAPADPAAEPRYDGLPAMALDVEAPGADRVRRTRRRLRDALRAAVVASTRPHQSRAGRRGRAADRARLRPPPARSAGPAAADGRSLPARDRDRARLPRRHSSSTRPCAATRPLHDRHECPRRPRRRRRAVRRAGFEALGHPVSSGGTRSVGCRRAR